jgi:hypothetical protein
MVGMEGAEGGGVGDAALSAVRFRVERRVSVGEVASARDERFGVALAFALEDFLARGVVSGSGVGSPRFNLADRRGVVSTWSSSML